MIIRQTKSELTLQVKGPSRTHAVFVFLLSGWVLYSMVLPAIKSYRDISHRTLACQRINPGTESSSINCHLSIDSFLGFLPQPDQPIKAVTSAEIESTNCEAVGDGNLHCKTHQVILVNRGGDRTPFTRLHFAESQEQQIAAQIQTFITSQAPSLVLQIDDTQRLDVPGRWPNLFSFISLAGVNIFLLLMGVKMLIVTQERLMLDGVSGQYRYQLKTLFGSISTTQFALSEVADVTLKTWTSKQSKHYSIAFQRTSRKRHLISYGGDQAQANHDFEAIRQFLQLS
ncbi:MAG: hypothetical protein AAFW84_12945 [Cyanobacteria bacterium J06635_15]